MTVRILIGDCRDVLRTLPDASVQCCVTSPPYYGLRDYGVSGQIGLEQTPEEYVAEMVEVFREVRRVLRDDGVLFLNLGDSYAGSQRAHAYGSVCKAKPSYRDRDSTSGNLDDGRKDDWSLRTRGIDGHLALARVAEPLTQIRACMEELAAHLPIEGYFRPIPNVRSSSAILGLAQTAIRAVEQLLASLDSKTPGFSLPPPADFRPLNTLSACRSSLHSFAACVRRCAYTLDEPSGIPERTTDTASLCEELAHHIQCTSEWCSIVLSWVEYKPQRSTIKPKDLIGIPWRVAFALQADGWYLRQDIIWHKPNPMPESVTDRCTKAHEYVFLLSKSERYYFDSEAMQEPANGQSEHDLTGGQYAPEGQRAHTGSRRAYSFARRTATTPPPGSPAQHRDDRDDIAYVGTRNKRSVWTVPTQPFRDAHFATFPPALIEPCILAGSRPGDTILDPFAGAGTTGLVADRLQRNAILIELNPQYAEMARRRIHGDAPLFAEVDGA